MVDIWHSNTAEQNGKEQTGGHASRHQASSFVLNNLLNIQYSYMVVSTLSAMQILKLRSEIVWHRFFAVPTFIRHFRSYIAVRKLLV